MTSNRNSALPCTVEVERERETRFMVRFKERIAETESPRLGTVYIAKNIAGNAKRLRIIIDNGGDE